MELHAQLSPVILFKVYKGVDLPKLNVEVQGELWSNLYRPKAFVANSHLVRGGVYGCGDGPYKVQ